MNISTIKLLKLEKYMYTCVFNFVVFKINVNGSWIHDSRWVQASVEINFIKLVNNLWLNVGTTQLPQNILKLY